MRKLISNIITRFIARRDGFHRMADEGISLFRHEDYPGKWCACDGIMGFDFGHNGLFVTADSPMAAYRRIRIEKERQCYLSARTT